MKTLTKICVVTLALTAESGAVDTDQLNSLSNKDLTTLSPKCSLYDSKSTPRNKLLNYFNTILPRTEPKLFSHFGFTKGTNRLYSPNQEYGQNQSIRHTKDYNHAPINTYDSTPYSKETRTGQKLVNNFAESNPYEDQGSQNTLSTRPTQYNLRNLLKTLLKEDANFYISAGLTCLFFLWCWGRISTTSKKTT